MDRHEFLYGIHSNKLKICPACGHKTLYWMGGGPKDIECANKECKFYQEKLDYGKKRIQFEADKPYDEEEKKIDEDTTEFMDGWDIGDLKGLWIYF